MLTSCLKQLWQASFEGVWDSLRQQAGPDGSQRQQLIRLQSTPCIAFRVAEEPMPRGDRMTEVGVHTTSAAIPTLGHDSFPENWEQR